MNWILTALAAIAFISALFSGKMEALGTAAIEGCGQAIPLVLSLVGALCLWSGLMEIAQRSGLTDKISKCFRPLIRILFPALQKDSETASLVSMNITANMLGLGNAATPLGLAAMERMPASSREAVTLVVLNTCSIQLIPTSVAAIRMATGSNAPMEIWPAMLAASVLSCMISLALVWICAKAFTERRHTS